MTMRWGFLVIGCIMMSGSIAMATVYLSAGHALAGGIWIASAVLWLISLIINIISLIKYP